MHLTDEQLNEYLDNEIHDRASIELHLTTCADCAARLVALQALFDEIESLPELELTRPLAAAVLSSRSLPAALRRFLTLTAIAQAALAIVAIIITAPFVTRFLSPYLSDLPAPSIVDIFLQIQTQWTALLDTLSTLQVPILPEIPVLDLSSFFVLFTLIGASLLWLIGNGLLLRNQIK